MMRFMKVNNFYGEFGMKEQRVVRTYPNGYTSTTGRLSELLQAGYYVVMCYQFSLSDGKEQGNEYIVEREVTDK